MNVLVVSPSGKILPARRGRCVVGIVKALSASALEPCWNPASSSEEEYLDRLVFDRAIGPPCCPCGEDVRI